MRRPLYFLTLLVLLLPGLSASAAQPNEVMWGVVYTSDNEKIEGAIRWGRSKDHWTDVIGGQLTTPIKLLSAENREGITLFGFRIGAGTEEYPMVQVPFGQIKSLNRTDSRTVELQIKDGSRIKLERSDDAKRDIGRNLFGVFVQPAHGEVVKVDWWKLKRVEFAAAPNLAADASPSSDGRERIFGTVTLGETKRTGRIRWDRDERFLDETLDGDVDGDDVEIEFGQIASIIPKLPGGSEVTLKDGTVQLVTGSNDVDSDHRGVEITEPNGFSRRFEYVQVDAVEFHPNRSPRGYADFDGGFRLRGVVTLKKGGSKSGLLHWDQEESYSWETLEGLAEQVRYSIPFSEIERIEPGARGSAVTLVSGEVLELGGTNDVNRRNRGIIVESDAGKRQVLEFDEVKAVEFERPRQRPAS